MAQFLTDTDAGEEEKLFSYSLIFAYSLLIDLALNHHYLKDLKVFLKKLLGWENVIMNIIE